MVLTWIGLDSWHHKGFYKHRSLTQKGCSKLNGTVSRDFLLLVFIMNQFPPAPEYRYSIRTVSNFFEKSRRYSQVKVHHRYQRHRRQIFPPVSLVANLSRIKVCRSADIISLKDLTCLCVVGSCLQRNHFR
jgi:hypothetical protein